MHIKIDLIERKKIRKDERKKTIFQANKILIEY